MPTLDEIRPAHPDGAKNHVAKILLSNAAAAMRVPAAPRLRMVRD
jgi:hypothetical protein